MNRFYQALRALERRPRFRVLGAICLLLLWSCPQEVARAYLVTMVLAASVFSGFLALHVRRQFATPQAHLAPDFFWAHFAATVFASLFICLGSGCYIAWHWDTPALPVISAQASALVVLAATAVWPKAIVLVLAAPLSFRFLIDDELGYRLFAQRYMAGETTWLYVIYIGLAVIGYFVMVWQLRRLSDMTVAASDDFTFNDSTSDLFENRWSDWLRNLRDRAVERRLLDRGRRGASLGLRCIPSTVPVIEIGLYAVSILLAVPLCKFLFGSVMPAWSVLLVGIGLMLFAPLSSWRFRCTALVAEYMQPTTRRTWVGQSLVAMGLDFAIWTAAASIVLFGAYPMLRIDARGNYLAALASQLLVIWGLASVLFGVAVTTLRLRAWLPPLFALLLGCVMLAGFGMGLLANWARYTRLPNNDALTTAYFAICCILIGLALVWRAYHRWQTVDVV